MISVIKYSPLVLLLIYFGVKLTPSLTPENKVWGSFNISHIQRYSLKYYTGYGSIKNINTSYNRIGSVFIFFHPQRLNLKTDEEKLFGKGLYEVVSGQYGRFVETYETGSYFGVENVGLVGGGIRYLYSLGYLATIFLFLLGIKFINTINNKVLFYILIFYYIWDFLLYYNQMLFSAQSAIIVLFLIHYYNHTRSKQIEKDNTFV